MFGIGDLWTMDQPDHSAIIGAVSRLDGKFESFRDEVMRRLNSQDNDLNMLKAANSVDIGRRGMAKVLFWTIPGAVGAAIIKLAEWLSANGQHLTPPPGTGTH